MQRRIGVLDRDAGRDLPASAEVVVDLDAVAANVAVVRARTAGAVMAVVKADAFGHGAVPVAGAALAAGATWLGVASTAEALALRDAGIDAPILCWLFHLDAGIARAVAADITLSVSSVPQLDAVAAAAREVGRPAAVHMKIDTGLARGGGHADDWAGLVERGRRHERAGTVVVSGVWSHLVDADADVPSVVPLQVARFDAALAVAARAGLRPAVTHLANSAAALHLPDTHADLVRLGIGLYGIEPVAARPAGLRPAMLLRSPAVLTKRVAAGSGVSYHHDYVTTRRTNLALVPVGYGDGLPRSASGRAEVWVDGRRRPVAGRIAMDQFVVDLGGEGCDTAEVVVFGPGDDGEPTVAEWAAWAGTIPHEILTGNRSRLARRFTGRDAPPHRPDGAKETPLVR